MEHIIERLNEALTEGNLAKAERARDDLLMSREEFAPALHLLAETICYRIEEPV